MKKIGFSSLFISHGPPSIAFQDSSAHRFLKALGRTMPKPSAVICISAHWETTRPFITSSAVPDIIYDFSGPPQRHQLSYKPPGAADLAEQVTDALRAGGLDADTAPRRGLDHGVWIPLLLMYPSGDVPVVQLSIQTEADSAYHFALGRALRDCVPPDVLIMGSGGAVHNLDAVREHAREADPPEYVMDFDNWLNDRICNGEIDAVVDYKRLAPEPERCHPYPAEHFLPLPVAFGAARSPAGKRLHSSFMYGTLSMAAYGWE